MKYKHKLTITFIAFITLTTSALAANTAPGPGGGGGGEITQEIELTGGSWNNIAVNVEGVSLSDSSGACELDTYEISGTSGYAWTVSGGEWVALSQDDELSTTKGYSVYAMNDCTLTFEGTQAGTSSERQLSGELWNLISLPPGVSPSDVQEAVEAEGAELQTWEDEVFWTNLGSEWTHPVDELSNNRPVYVNPTESVSITLDGATESPGPGDDSGDDSSDDSDSGDDSSDDAEETTAEAGDLYFWDTDSGSSLVNNEAGSPDDSATLSYNMYDDAINGRFTSHGSGERTITVEGPRGEASNTGSGNYVSYPADGSNTWGTEEDEVKDEVNKMLGSYTESTFTVTVEDAGTGEQLQEEEFTFDPSAQPRDITTDLENRNTDHVTISGSSLDFDGSGHKNAYATWEKAMGSDERVEIDFEVSDPGHIRLEVCGESCGDGDDGDIHAAYFLYEGGNVRVDEPFDGGSAYEDEKVGEYETNSEYTFRIIEDGATVTMELEGPGVDHSTEVEEGYTFEQFSIDTEKGTDGPWPGTELTVNEATMQEN